MAVVREEGFEPLSDAAVASYDIYLAHYELGPGLHAVFLAPAPVTLKGDMGYVPLARQIGILHATARRESLRREFRMRHPELNDKQLWEITWDASPEAGLSDAGRDRLTVWFQSQGDKWVWRYHRKWFDSE